MRALIFLFAFAVCAHAEDAELLPPEQAFQFSARAVAADEIEVKYDIAQGYYLYRDKFQFEVSPESLVIGPPALPPGKVHEDEFFGKVETYRGALIVRLPLKRSGNAPQSALLTVTSQGCADAGVCYVPHAQKATVMLAAASNPPSAEQEFLPPDQAFKVEVKSVDANTVQAHFTPAEGYYFYRDKTAFSVQQPARVQVSEVALPRGEMKSDPNFGDVEVFHRPFDALISLQSTKPADKITLQAVYQGCAEAGLCYPPITKAFQVALASTGAGPSGTSSATPDESGRIANLLGGNFLLLAAGFFGIGLALAFTPCVFPMIPILSGIIAGEGASLTRNRALALSAAYVLGMALTYALAGIAAGLSGAMLSAALQNPWVLGSFAAVFVFLALSMFGFYDLQLPAGLQSKLSQASNRVKGGRFAGAFVMGALSAIIVGPCVTPALAGALLVISQSGDVARGGSALFAMALGMGAPLLAVGTSAGALLPRAGPWMDAVKQFFGVLLLGVAIWIVSPVIPAVAHMLLWAALLIMSAIYLRALDPLPHPASGISKFGKSVGVLALLAGIALLVGALSGGRDVLQPLAGLRSGATSEESHLSFERVKTLGELDSRVDTARGRVVMLDFYADWCVACKEMERFTFSDPRVQARLKDAVLLQADVTANNADDSALLQRFQLFGPPGIIFYDPNGQELNFRVIGYQPPEKFLQSLDRVMSNGKEVQG
ncbi:MAG: protein-disulfide reductase DsbD [Burkholderiales bacterium]